MSGTIKIDEIPKTGTGFEAMRVDRWDGRGRHWVTYFKQADDGAWFPYTTAVSPFRTKDGYDEEGVSKAIKALEEDGKTVRREE